MQVYRQLRQTLVIVPSDALRAQIANKFVSLDVLPDAGVVPRELIGPIVANLTTGLGSVEGAAAVIEKFNIIVTLPQKLSASASEALEALTDHCTDLIVDEAHHIPAFQWSNMREMIAASTGQSSSTSSWAIHRPPITTADQPQDHPGTCLGVTTS